MKTLLFMAVFMVATACIVSAEEVTTAAAPAKVVKEESPNAGFSFAAAMDLYSAYVWRGTVPNDRPVWQPGGTVSYAAGDYGTFSANVWGNFDMTDHKGHTSFGGLNEVDYTASYAIDVGPVSLSVGHIWYTFPQVTGPAYGKSTREVYATAQYNSDIVNPFVKVYYDYEAIEGFYGNFGLNKTITLKKLSDRLSVGSEVSLGVGDGNYMAGYFYTDNTAGLADFNAAVFTAYKLTDNLSVGARLAWMSLVDSAARDNADHQDLLWGGVNLSASF